MEMQKKDIGSREDVQLLVASFYGKVRTDAILAPIFNAIITDWEAHLQVLVDFWEAQLFLKRDYKGNPVAVHQAVDEKMGHTVTSEHFGLWLNLWFATIDALFDGETAWLAKNRAQKMSTMLFIQIFQNRKT